MTTEPMDPTVPTPVEPDPERRDEAGDEVTRDGQ